MSSFAEISNNNIVLRVVEVPEEQEERGQEYLSKDCNLGGLWILTVADGSFRKNFASVGYLYDNIRDAFIPPKPYPSWALNEETCRWDAPIPMPDIDGHTWVWDELTLSWVDVNPANTNIIESLNIPIS